MAGLTLDSSALIAYERTERRMLLHLKQAVTQAEELTVPSVVVAEVWRGGTRSARVARLLNACRIEPLFDDLARLAGEAIAAVRGAGVVDAIVMASAARRGDRVLTADFGDLDRLTRHFRSVRILGL
jgi:predicted nucleic acid-binding protein